MRKLLIHIGTMKTGTSSIQDCLHSSAAALRKKDIYYYPQMHHNNHSFSPLFKENPAYSYDWKKNYGSTDVGWQVQQLKKKWASLWKTMEQGTAIVSSETMSFYSYEDVERLRSFVGPLFDQVTVIVYFRDPGKYIPSMLQQDIKNGYTPSDLSFLEYYRGRKIDIRYRELLLRWTASFGSEHVIVRPFQKKSFYGGALERDFFYHGCGVEIEPEVIGSNRKNESLNLESALFLYELNRKYPTIKSGLLNEERGLAGKPLPAKVFAAFPGRKIDIPLHYDLQTRKNMQAQVRYVNQFLPAEERIECTLPEEKVEGQADAGSLDLSASILDTDYYVEIINAYNKLLEDKNKKIMELENSLEAPRRKAAKKWDVAKEWGKIKRWPARGLSWIQYLLFRNRVDFDEELYKNTYGDIDYSRMPAIKHFFLYGAAEGRIPRKSMKQKEGGLLNPLVRERLMQRIGKQKEYCIRVKWTDCLAGDYRLDALGFHKGSVTLVLPSFSTYVFWTLQSRVLEDKTVDKMKKEYVQFVQTAKRLVDDTGSGKLITEQCFSGCSTENPIQDSVRVAALLQYCLSKWSDGDTDVFGLAENVLEDLRDTLYSNKLMDNIQLEAAFNQAERQILQDAFAGAFQIKEQYLEEAVFVEWMNCHNKALEMVGVNDEEK